MKLLSCIIAGVAIFAGALIYHFNSPVDNSPKVFAGIIIEEYDGMVPLFLSSIDQWEYNKRKIAMDIRLISSSNEVREIVEKWIKDHRSSYDSLTLMDERARLMTISSRLEINRNLAQIKDGFMASSKELDCDYCFITSSNTLVTPDTLSTLIDKEKPIISPLLNPVPKSGDPFRNFFAAVSDIGYYKDDAQYLPIANREITGTFAMPCVHIAYLIDTDYIDRLSFSKDFVDWEFISFAKSARNGNVQQFISNEKEFGVFLLLDEKMTKNECLNYSLIDNTIKLTPEYTRPILEPYYKSSASLKKSLDSFTEGQYQVFKLRDGNNLVVNDIHKAISKYYLSRGFASENHIINQIKKYAKSGSEVLVVGIRGEADPGILSAIVGDNGKVHVWEPEESAFRMQAVNLKLNETKNVLLHDSLPNQTDNKIDDLHLNNLSLISISTNGSEADIIKSGIKAIKAYKPVLLVAIADDADRKAKIDEISSLGYVYTAIANDLYLFIPHRLTGITEESESKKPVLPPIASLLSHKNPAFNPEINSNRTPVKVTWEGTFLDFSSLSHVNRSLTGEVLKYPSIELTSVEHYKHNLNPKKFEELIETAKRVRAYSPPGTEITVRHKFPPNWEKPAQGKWVLIQPWEYGILPADWMDHLKNVDEIWVPTHFVKQVYADSGISPDKVFVVPNGINPKIFNEEVKPYSLPTKKSFKFLFLGGAILRKGADILLNSYMQAFDETDDVCLVIKDFGTKGGYATLTIADYIKQAQQKPGGPEIYYIDDDMDIEQIASMYAACDCLVYPYRGEGFAMPVLEAMACGIPVMVTDGGATDDFVNDSLGWKIPSQRNSVGTNADGYELAKEGWRLESDGEILSGMMRWVSEHPELAKKKGAAAARFAKEYMTWDMIAPIVVERLEALSEQ